MADLLIQHLEKTVKKHSALAILSSQWGYDSLLIPKALQHIVTLFPHYSLHDASHSKQILVNIERLLGNNIDKLSACDTWLLLESAYCHDIGMVVTHNEYKEALEDPRFSNYLNEIRQQPHHDLYKFSQSFNPTQMETCFTGADDPIDAICKFQYLMAEWFRRKHAERSKEIVESPLNLIGLSSPRTELIPKRLYSLVGQICLMHGKSFEALITELPFRQAGLANEDCHPRFVACLLRMGDLLDLDNNRFCPVMQQITGENRPALTCAHEDKHLSIRHLRIDSQRIEISAECETIDGYVECRKWFDWIRQEMQQQMMSWEKIVPERAFGLLPMLGDLHVKLKGKKLIDGKRPEFSVDQEKVIELVQGANLYGSEYACIRELLQNAEDATLLRIWLENKGEKGWENPSPDDPKIQEKLKQYPITIDFREDMDQQEVANDKTRWIFSITDQGTGISEEDLRFMLKIAGSQKNTKRQQEIYSMPEWMKPSGAFGIGFQSVYQLKKLQNDAIELDTKSIFSNEHLKVILYNPTGKTKGLVDITAPAHNFKKKYGTTIEVKLLLDRNSQDYPQYFSGKTSVFAPLEKDFDPQLTTDKRPKKAAEFIDAIIKYFDSNLNLIPIQLNVQSLSGGPDTDKTWGVSTDFSYINIENKWIGIKYTPIGSEAEYSLQNSFKTYFRGKIFIAQDLDAKYRINIPATIQVNILSGKANEWLHLNREHLNGDKIDVLNNLIITALIAYIEKETISDNNIKELSYLAACISEYFGILPSENLSHLQNKWLDLDFSVRIHAFSSLVGQPVLKNTMSHLLKQTEWLIVPRTYDLDLQRASNYRGISKGIVIDKEELLYKLILNQIEDNRLYIKYILLIDNKPIQQGCLISTKEMPLAPPYYYEGAFLAAMLHEKQKTSFLLTNQRYLLKLNEGVLEKSEIEKLYFQKDPPTTFFLFTMGKKSQAECILLPFLFKQDGTVSAKERLDELCAWLKNGEYLVKSDITITEIKKLYLRIINYIDYEVMKKSAHWESWRKARDIPDMPSE